MFAAIVFIQVVAFREARCSYIIFWSVSAGREYTMSRPGGTRGGGGGMKLAMVSVTSTVDPLVTLAISAKLGADCAAFSPCFGLAMVGGCQNESRRRPFGQHA